MVLLNVGSKIRDNENNEYELLNIIGSGGFGCVFQAVRKSDNKYFAIKTMLPSFGGSGDQKVFENEIFAALKIRGENIIRYEFVNDGKTLPEYPPFIIMEYANGGTLRSLIGSRDNQFFSNGQIVSMFKQLCAGMKTINQSLVHRDVKPENILVDGNTLKITDFGLAKIVTESTRTNTFKGGGTCLYMAPEAWTFAPNTIQMDIYSMGIVFFEIASLQYPYSLKTKTAEECKSAHLNGSIKNLNMLNPNLSPAIVSVINRMLEKQEKRRFKNWDEIIAFLDKNDAQPSRFSDIVNSLILTKTGADLKKQREAEAYQKRVREENEFYDLVKGQFNNEILAPIRNMIEEYNSTCADSDKFTPVRYNIPSSNAPKYYYEFSTQFRERIILGLWAVRENSLQREEFNTWALADGYRESIFGPRTYNVNYTLTYKDKPVVGLAKIYSVDTNLGFNLMLVKNEGLYGDWYILQGRNSFIASHSTRKEPFAFDFGELPKQIEQKDVMGFFSLNISPFTEDRFLQTLVSIMKKS